MAIWEQIPAIVRVMAVFFIILLAIRKKVSLGNAFLLGAIILGLMFHFKPAHMLRSMFFSIMDPKTILLTVTVSLILLLSHSMDVVGQMDRMLDKFQGLIKHPGINLVIFPALIGLLPMPGGAIFSAPMVKNIAGQRNIPGSQLSYINYWFRHIWEYWWPLYPGILLAATLAGIDLWVFILFSAPLTLVAVFLGSAPVRHTLKRTSSNQPALNMKTSSLGGFLSEFLPIAIVIVVGLGLGVLLSYRAGPIGIRVGKELGLITSLLISIGWVWHAHEMPWRQRWSLMRQPQVYRMIYMIFSILIFKGVLQDSQAVKAVSEELVQWHIWMMPVAVILPLLVGLVAGVTIATVGATFPILISLLKTVGESHLLLPYMILALASGFVGVLLSPLHICLLMSNEYFQTSLGAVYRHLWAPCLLLLIASSLYFVVLHGFMS